MGSPLSTTPNFAFLCLLVTENCVPNCLLAWCRHICCLMVCLHAPLRMYKCLSDWNQASQAVIQGNKPVFSLSDLELLTCPHQRIDLTRPGPPHPTHTPWLTSFSSFSTFSSPYTSRRSDFKTPPPPWTFIPNSTEVSSSLLLNPTFFYVVQLPCTCWCASFTYFPQYEPLGVFCQLEWKASKPKHCTFHMFCVSHDGWPSAWWCSITKFNWENPKFVFKNLFVV